MLVSLIADFAAPTQPIADRRVPLSAPGGAAQPASAPGRAEQPIARAQPMAMEPLHHQDYRPCIETDGCFNNRRKVGRGYSMACQWCSRVWPLTSCRSSTSEDRLWLCPLCFQRWYEAEHQCSVCTGTECTRYREACIRAWSDGQVIAPLLLLDGISKIKCRRTLSSSTRCRPTHRKPRADMQAQLSLWK